MAFKTATDSTLIGRDQELARLEAILERRQPALIVVTGDIGLGKTKLLRELSVRASAREWRVVPGEKEDALTIGPDTTEEAFRRMVMKLLDLSDAESRIDMPSDDEQQDSVNDLVVRLREQARTAPLLLLIDGYRPSDAFATWFMEQIVADVRRGEAPVVLVVAPRSGTVHMWHTVADEVVELGPIESQFIRVHFEQLNQEMAPAMSQAEIDHYSQAACEKPEVFDRLARVLKLASGGAA